VFGLLLRSYFVVIGICTTFTFASFTVVTPKALASNPDKLWEIIHNQCEPNYVSDGIYAPCSLVDEDTRTVLYKVDNEPYQYLLLPLDRISGVEDSSLLEPPARDYLYESWQARDLVTTRLKNSLAETNLLLAVNSKNSRTQNQLHVHISCVSPATRNVLNNTNLGDYTDWKALPAQINEHTYLAKRITLTELKTRNLFTDINLQVAADREQMQYATVALANLTPNTFLLLLGEGTQDRPVGAEELQDHTCALANQ
jgi:CDP-diacylglycerol pyrophosphatase